MINPADLAENIAMLAADLFPLPVIIVPCMMVWGCLKRWIDVLVLEAQLTAEGFIIR